MSTLNLDYVDPLTSSTGPLLPVVGEDYRVPLVTGGTRRYVNLDVAASSPALRSVADRVAEFLPHYSSVNRGAGHPSIVSSTAYEAARTTVASFVGARADDVVQFVRHTTDALNLLATAVPGEVVHLDIEHHAAQLPWRRRGSRVVPARATIAATLTALEAELGTRPAALLVVTGASNVTGELLPIALLADLAHAHGARIAVDGAQLTPHRRVDLAGLDLDYLALSGHKLYAPYGAGVLVGRRDWLDDAPPYLAGGGAVTRVSLTEVDWRQAPHRHEAGTPHVIGAVALAAACETLSALPEGRQEAHERTLRDHLLDGLDTVPGLRVLRLWPESTDTLGLATFSISGHRADLVAQYLSAEHGIGVRSGRFCAHPLLERLNDGVSAVRASLGVGSSAGDVERLVTALHSLTVEGPRWTYDSTALPHPDPRPIPTWASGATRRS